MHSNSLTSRGRNRNRTISIFREPSRVTSVKSNNRSNIKPTKTYKHKHKHNSSSSQCVRGWYHVTEKPRNVIKQYNIIIT